MLTILFQRIIGIDTLENPFKSVDEVGRSNPRKSLVTKIYYFSPIPSCSLSLEVELSLAWKEESTIPLIRISINIPQICIQAVKRNVFITEECCTHILAYSPAINFGTI